MAEGAQVLAADLRVASLDTLELVAGWMLERGWTEPIDDAGIAAADGVIVAFRALPDRLRAMVERAGVVFDKWPVADPPRSGWTPEALAALDPEVRWQGIAFSLYTEWVLGPLADAIRELGPEPEPESLADVITAHEAARGR